MLNLDLDFTVYDMFDFGGQPCNTEPEFDKDACTENKLDKKSLQRLGCTTPFGPIKDKTCQNHENGSKVMDLYTETMKNHVDNCNSPCSFVLTKMIKTGEREVNGKGLYVYIHLKENIHVIRDYHLYSVLSMIAEVGGYVCLFLGISVNQVSALFNVILDKLHLICNRKKIFF